MLHQRVPKHLPTLPMMLADLGNPHPTDLALTMGVSRNTVYRWLRDGTAPRPVLLALFWMTNWGVSQINCDAVNDAQQQAAMARCLKRELKTALDRVDHLTQIAQFGAANDPAQPLGRGALLLPTQARFVAVQPLTQSATTMEKPQENQAVEPVQPAKKTEHIPYVRMPKEPRKKRWALEGGFRIIPILGMDHNALRVHRYIQRQCQAEQRSKSRMRFRMKLRVRRNAMAARA